MNKGNGDTTTYNSKKLYVSNVQWFESIQHISSMNDMTKQLRKQLDSEGLLDAKWYFLRYFVLDNPSFIKQYLHKPIKYDDLTINQIFYLVDRYKEILGLDEKDEDSYPITSYTYRQYKDNLKYKSSIQPITIVKEFEKEKISDYTSITNTLINTKYTIDQTIGEHKIVHLITLFHQGDGESLGEMIEELNMKSKIESHKNIDSIIKQYCESKNDLIVFITRKIKIKKRTELHRDIMIEFFKNCYYLYTNIQSIQGVTNNHSKTYQSIKNHIKNFISHVLDKESYEFHDTTTKKGERIFDKIINKYDGDLLDIKDITRCAFVFEDINHLVGGLQRIFRSFHDPILYNSMIKDKNGNPLVEVDDKIGLILKKAIKPSGYRDITLVLHFQSDTGLLPMEIQLHLKDMYTMKTKGIGGVYSLLVKEDIITASEIAYINDLVFQKGSSYFLPTNDDEVISSDKIYGMRRLFKEDQNHTTSTSFSKATKNIVDSIVGALGGKKDMNMGAIIDKLSVIECGMNNFAWKKIIDKINLPPKGHATIKKQKKKYTEEISKNLSNS